MNRENFILKQSLAAGPDCPPVEALTAEDAHVKTCAHCRNELAMLLEFEAGAVRPEEASDVQWIAARLAQNLTPAPAPKVRPGWWRPQVLAWCSGAAAVAVIAIGLSSQPGHRAGDPVPEFGTETQRALAVEVLPAAGLFAWKPVSGAAQYELTVSLVDGAVIFHNFFTKPTLAYPSEIANTMSTGKLLLWEVSAKDATGKEIARSGVQKLMKAE